MREIFLDYIIGYTESNTMPVYGISSTQLDTPFLKDA